MRNSSSLDWLRFMHTPNDYRVSRFQTEPLFLIIIQVLIYKKRGNLSYLFLVHPQGLEPWTH